MAHDNTRDPLLMVSNLTLKHRTPAGATTILHDVSISLQRGEVLGLIGESGAGKSTLGNAILGLLAADFERTAGTILFDGKTLDGMDEHQWAEIRGRRISAIFQDHTASLDRSSKARPGAEAVAMAETHPPPPSSPTRPSERRSGARRHRRR